jgi:hypothetical protein
MEKIYEHRSDKANFDIYKDGQIPEIYCDGAGQFLLGYPNTKISFYSSQGANGDNGVEQRVLKAQISMPTQAWIDLLSLLTKNINDSKDMLEAAVTAHGTRILDHISSSGVASNKK